MLKIWTVIKGILKFHRAAGALLKLCTYTEALSDLYHKLQKPILQLHYIQLQQIPILASYGAQLLSPADATETQYRTGAMAIKAMKVVANDTMKLFNQGVWG